MCRIRAPASRLAARHCSLCVQFVVLFAIVKGSQEPFSACVTILTDWQMDGFDRPEAETLESFTQDIEAAAKAARGAVGVLCLVET